jgi:hypothetical protein
MSSFVSSTHLHSDADGDGRASLCDMLDAVLRLLLLTFVCCDVNRARAIHAKRWALLLVAASFLVGLALWWTLTAQTAQALK